LKTTKLSIIKTIFIIIISLIIGLNIYSWNTSKLLGDAMPMPSGYGSAIVLSGSMEPELSIDDLIIVKKTNNYQKGDIIVYQRKQELIVHRIVKINENTVITKGDANNVNDKEVEISEIKGKVVKVVPKVGKLIAFIKKPVVVSAVLLLSIIAYIFSNKEEQKIKKLELIELEKEVEKYEKLEIIELDDN